MKGGIVYADIVTTAELIPMRKSKEISRRPFYGEHLDGLMRARSNSLVGIVKWTGFRNEYGPGKRSIHYLTTIMLRISAEKRSKINVVCSESSD